MSTQQSSLSKFHRTLWLTLFVFIVFVFTFLIYVRSEKEIDYANDRRHLSVRLAKELRQSSDDLTRLVRSYIITGDPIDKQHYQEILDIRDGKKPRPVDYHNVYWDLVLADDQRPRPLGPAIALLDLMRQADFTELEFAKLVEAKHNSDLLTDTEFAAMQLLEGTAVASEATRERARLMLHDAVYQRAKAKIMQPIAEFDQMINERTLFAVRTAENRAALMRGVFVLLSLFMLYMLWRTYRALNVTLGGSVDEIHRYISHLGRGDFSPADVRGERPKESVFGWLMEMQTQLHAADARRKAAELGLADSEASLRTIIETEPECIKIVDQEGRLHQMNRAGLAMIEADELATVVNQPVLDLVALEHRAAFFAMHQRVIAGEAQVMEFEIVGLKGTRRWMETHAVPMRVGERIMQLAVTRDISQRKQAMADLERYRLHLEELVAERTSELVLAKKAAETANVAKSAFIANMSHEIRTPLNAITGMVHLIRRAGATPQQVERLDKIEVAGQHLLETINAILDLSKIEAGKFTLEETDVNVGAITANVVSMLFERAQAKNLELVVCNEPIALHLQGDATRLQQALLNYATNAIKFTESGRITLRTRVEAEMADSVRVRFEVEDTGIGIAPENLSRLFSSFEQADNSITRKYGGTGLGLAINRKFAELMGGETGATSRPGNGSIFWLTAVLKKVPGLAPLKPSRVSPGGSAESQLISDFRNLRVLVVEDEPVNREVTLETLGNIWPSVDVAENGIEAVELAGKNQYGLILMDMQMPLMDGLEATRRIRLLANCRQIPIIAMTANAFAEDKTRCFAAGMNDFITKPMAPELFFSTLLTCLLRQE